MSQTHKWPEVFLHPFICLGLTTEYRQLDIHYHTLTLRTRLIALAYVGQYIECQPANQRVAGSIPSQGSCLSCRPGPPVRGM